MAAPLESELKYELDSASYRKLLSHFRGRISRGVKQENHYFDDPRSLALRRRQIGLRIRLATGRRPLVTLKFPAAQRPRGPASLKIRHEYEAPIPRRTARDVIAGERAIAQIDCRPIKVLAKLVTDNALGKLERLGGMTTLRREARLGKSLKLEIDRFDMFGERFYELEVESTKPREADRLVRKLFAELGIACRPSPVSKLARFMQLRAR